MVNFNSKVEQSFLKDSKIQEITTKVPYIITDSVPKLGVMTALRFLEWVSQNEEGVISLSSDKMFKNFIHYTHHFLNTWDEKETKKVLEKYGLADVKKPNLSGLQFVQMEEFYPISPKQHNSFFHYVNENYINGFGLDPERALFINCDDIKLYNNKSFNEIFPDFKIDLGLRYRQAENETERIQQQSLFMIDDWCSRYEEKIKAKGDIGFMLCTLGSDGRIAFNISGTSQHSNTELRQTNYATQADAASSLGGIEVAKNRLVITIGLETITRNPMTTAIVCAAGESNATTIKNALESEMTTQYPATVLQRLENSRFYLTEGAASLLNDSVNHYYFKEEWNFQKTEKAILALCKKLNRYASKLTLEDLLNDEVCRMIPNISLETVNDVIKSVEEKLFRGSVTQTNKVIYNSGPHHDDIMLGIMPLTNRQLRPVSNNVHFAVMTSGYNSVTNGFLCDSLKMTLDFIEKDEIQMVHYPDFFEEGYKHKYDKDIYHYLDSVARDDQYQMNRGFCHRLLRCSVTIWQFKNLDELKTKYKEVIDVLERSYDGEKNTSDLQRLKGMIREFEEELVWAYNGVQVKNVHHLHLGFYQDSGVSKGPNMERDVMPILNQFREIQPNIISVTLDPEGSGPDTHYKVLQATAAAVAEWSKEKDLSDLRIYGYRNVWFKFDPADANMYVPVSLNALAVLDKSFTASYLSQVKAEFPSPFYNGPFSDISKRTWIKQLQDIQLILGKDYFYENPRPLIRSTHGLIFIKDMNVDEFIAISEDMRRRSEEAI